VTAGEGEVAEQVAPRRDAVDLVEDLAINPAGNPVGNLGDRRCDLAGNPAGNLTGDLVADLASDRRCDLPGDLPGDLGAVVGAPWRAWLRDLRFSPLTRGQRAILRSLAGWMDANGEGAWPSLDAIADSAGYSRAWVAECLNAAEAAGWLARDRSRGGTDRCGRGITTRYRAVVPADSELGRHWAGATPAELRRGRRNPTPPPPRPRAGQLSSGDDTTVVRSSTELTPSPAAAANTPAAAGEDPAGGAAAPTTTNPHRCQTAERPAPRVSGAGKACAHALAAALPDGEAARAVADTRRMGALAAAATAALAAGWTAGELVDQAVTRCPLPWPAAVMYPAGLLHRRLGLAIAGRTPAAVTRRRQLAADHADRAAGARQTADHADHTAVAAASSRQLRAWHDQLTPDQRDQLHTRLINRDPYARDALQVGLTPGLLRHLHTLAHDLDEPTQADERPATTTPTTSRTHLHSRRDRPAPPAGAPPSSAAPEPEPTRRRGETTPELIARIAARGRPARDPQAASDAPGATHSPSGHPSACPDVTAADSAAQSAHRA